MIAREHHPCTSCEHHNLKQKGQCDRDASPSVVTGEADTGLVPCVEMRAPGHPCGPEGKLFKKWSPGW